MSQATPEADLETKAYSQEPPPAHLYPNANAVDWRQKDAALAEHLNTVFSPLQFPPELASRILTHASHPDAKLRHNGRLSFVGESPRTRAPPFTHLRSLYCPSPSLSHV